MSDILVDWTMVGQCISMYTHTAQVVRDGNLPVCDFLCWCKHQVPTCFSKNIETWQFKAGMVEQEKSSITRPWAVNMFPWQPKHASTSVTPRPLLGNSPLHTFLDRGGILGSSVFCVVHASVVFGPRRGLTPRLTGRLTISRNVTLTKCYLE